MTSVTSPEEICNLALDAIGYPTMIGDLFEGTDAARACLRAYAQSRDDLLRSQDWPFAERIVAGAKTNAQTAPAPWTDEYDWPADCLKLRYVQPSTEGTFPQYDPRPILFKVFNDQRASPAIKAILANVAGAKLVYTGQVIDVTTWEPSFVDTLVALLAKRLALILAPGSAVDVKQLAERDAAVQLAENLGSQENQPPDPSLAWRFRAAQQQK